MSDIHRRIVTLFEARGAGQIRAQLGEMRSGFGGFRRELQDSDRSARQYGAGLGLVDKQLRALGTTLRYTVAGGAVFGGFTAIRNLNQIQQQLGLISAISPTAFSGTVLAGQALTDFGESAEDAAFRALTPISEFNQGLINLVSTVQNVPQNQVVPILEMIARAAKTSQTPVEEATKGITGLLVAFGEVTNMGNVQRRLAQYQRAIYSVPGGVAAGPQIIQQLPQLAATARIAAINPEQMFGLLTTVLRAGGTPSTSARGLQYLMQGLGQPPSVGAASALRGIGVTPQFVQEQGGIAALLKLIQEVRTRGVTGAGPRGQRLKGLPPELEDQLEGLSSSEQLAGLGISGQGAVFARQAVGRIHGVRSLVLLAAQDDQMIEDLRMMADLGRNTAEQTDELGGAWQRFADRAKLQEVSVAIDQMAVDIAQVFEPVLNFTGRRGVIPLRNLIDEHPNEFVIGGLAAAGAFAARRGLRGLGGGAARGIGAAHAISSLGNEGLGASVSNPMFVAVVYSLSGPGGGGWFGRRGRAEPPIPGGPGGRPPRRGIPGGAKGGLGFLGAVTGATALWEYRAMLGQEGDQERAIQGETPFLTFLRKKRGGFGIPLGITGLSAHVGGDTPDRTSAQDRILDRLKKGYINEQAAERMLRRTATPEQQRLSGLKLKGELDLTVNTPEGKKKRTVPMTLVPDFSPFAPQTRGQDKTYRGP